MRLFLELTKLAFQRQLTYRAATLAGLATNIFFGILRAAVLVALYGVQTQVAGMTITDAITYTGISQAAIAFLSLFGWYDVMNSVYTGEIATDLLKPMYYFTFWLGQDLGRAMANFLLRGVTVMAFYTIVFKISVPHGWQQWIALALALGLSWMVSFSWRFLVNLASFWTPNAMGIGRFAFILSWFLSGFMMPLRFFPDWFVRLCYLTPFPYTVNAIVEIYLDLLTGKTLVLILLGQILWIIVLIGIIQVVLRAGVRRLEILGG